MRCFYYSFLHWGIFASMEKLRMYVCMYIRTHSQIIIWFFSWTCEQHMALLCVKTKQRTWGMEEKEWSLILVLVLQKTPQHFPDPWDDICGNNISFDLTKNSTQREEISLKRDPDGIGHWATRHWEQRGWLSLCWGSEPDLSAGQCLGTRSP